MFKRSDFLLLTAAAISFAFSVALWFRGFRDEGMFVGIWVPSILCLGIYIHLLARRR